MRGTDRLDAIAIWNAAVSAVDSETLVRHNLRIDGDVLRIGNRQFSLDAPRHIEVVGAGKAGAGMARAVEPVFADLPSNITWDGWINVPDDCVSGTSKIRLHGARPAGINEPTAAGVDGTREILRRVARLTPNDICIVLLSGGGSALLPAPLPQISLNDKLIITRLLAESGATIQELNVVRSRLSAVKAGGLARACNAGQLITLIISDVIGDPLEFIASGPTFVRQESSDDRHTHTGIDPDPLDIIRRYDPTLSRVPQSVVQTLTESPKTSSLPTCSVTNQIIGNNTTALQAAATEAASRGYQIVDLGSENCGRAADLGESLFGQLQSLRPKSAENQPVCVLAGGETTVSLCDSPGKGGRNQEIVLSAIAHNPSVDDWQGITLLSGGTDGEDGPTPSAGAVADEELVNRMHANDVSPMEFLTRNNAWPFFHQLDGLLNTGPTHTNVMDVQVGIVTDERTLR